MRTSAILLFGLPSGLYSLSSRKRSSFTCTDSEISPISSRNSVPVSAASTRPGVSARASVQEHLLRERLRQVVVGTSMKVVDRTFDRSVAGHDDDRNRRIVRLHRRKELIPRQHGHADVGDEDVDLAALHALECLLAI